MAVVTARALSGDQDRLAQARLALRRAEERTGLRDLASREVQRALTSASAGPSGAVSTEAGSPQTASLGTSPATSLMTSLTALAAAQDSGALSLQGSSTLLLAALALRQGSAGWCAVVGGEGLGWCAATEVGLDLNRVLTVPASVLDDASALTVTSTLLDGVEALLISAPVATRLRPQHRRRLLARARERGHLILTPVPWEGARTLRATPGAPDTGTETAPCAQPPVGSPVGSLGPSADGVVVPIGRRASAAVAQRDAQAVEMPAGYLRRLNWTLTDAQRLRAATVGALTLSLSAEGLQAGSHAHTQADPRSEEAVG